MCKVGPTLSGLEKEMNWWECRIQCLPQPTIHPATSSSAPIPYLFSEDQAAPPLVQAIAAAEMAKKKQGHGSPVPFQETDQMASPLPPPSGLPGHSFQMS